MTGEVTGALTDRSCSSRCRGDRGASMAMTSVFIVVMIVAMWSVLSATQAWSARREVQAVANAAARAAVQASPSEASTSEIILDPARANARAQSVLAAAGYSGSASVSGDRVIVTATGPVTYSFPAPGFPHTLTATASAVASVGAST